MSNYQFVEPGAAFPGVSATATTPALKLGLIAGAVDPSLGYAEFVYVQGAAASAPTAGDLVMLTGYSAGQAGTGRTGSQGIVGVAPAALSGTGVFGWVQLYGLCDFAKASNTSAAVGVAVQLGSTLGLVHGTASATGFRLDGAYFNQYSNTANSNAVVLQLYYPVYNGR